MMVRISTPKGEYNKTRVTASCSLSWAQAITALDKLLEEVAPNEIKAKHLMTLRKVTLEACERYKRRTNPDREWEGRRRARCVRDSAGSEATVGVEPN